MYLEHRPCSRHIEADDYHVCMTSEGEWLPKSVHNVSTMLKVKGHVVLPRAQLREITVSMILGLQLSSPVESPPRQAFLNITCAKASGIILQIIG